MTARPLVAVPAMRSPKIVGLRRSGVVMAERIAECVFRAGGEPLVFYGAELGDTAARLAAFDAVVMPGGRDVDPGLYTDQPAHERTDVPDPSQDAADLAVAKAVVSAGLPTLAICRGMQIFNVAFGGSLNQHLEATEIDHANNQLHEVRLTPGSRIAEVMGSETVSVSSYHHQGVDRVAAGVAVVGRAADGCVEAFEFPGADVLAVQWHPEDNAHEATEQQALFDALVASALSRSTHAHL